MQSLKVGVVGSGISGLSAAWALSRSHDVTLFERSNHAGGHVNTVDIDVPEGRVPVDTGFIVFNEKNYPNLTALFRHLGVTTHPTDMSFALSLGGGAYEYSGSGLAGFFGQPANIACAGHWRLLADILRFFRAAPGLIAIDDQRVTLGEVVAASGYSRRFVEDHLLPMGAAIWSTSMDRMLDFPAGAFLRFYDNHGLLKFAGRPRWRSVGGGGRDYVTRLLADSNIDLRLGLGAARILRRGARVHVEDTSGVVHAFDHLVVATHADQALALLDDADPFERELLGAFSYQRNVAVLHSDPAWMPRRRRLWSSWNYLKSGGDPGGELCVTYWMNALQHLSTETDVFVTLNPATPVREDRVWGVYDYDHPVFDTRAAEARSRLWELQGRRRTWFCGAHFGDGFHEDGIQSGLAVAEQLGGVRRPWRVAGESGRIALAPGSAGMPVPEAAE